MEKKTNSIRISKHVKKEKTYQEFALMVIDWYEKCGRHDLPWRKNITPYTILVSEVMLQQTQVSRVLPKFALWMKTYPSLKKLRDASLRDVLLLWQGLGYQRRAKALLSLSAVVTQLPKNHTALVALPGIGDYTASAIMAFAYDRECVMLETNIRTALIEAFHRRKKYVDDSLLKKDLEALVHIAHVKVIGPRHWYYALMDYGAFLKSKKVSHNLKVKGYRTQSPFFGSIRKLRAEVLFAITKNGKLPHDHRVPQVLESLVKEGFIKPSKTHEWKIM